MFYSYKDCVVTIDDFPIYANNISISQNASLSPTYVANQRNSFEMAPTDGVVTKISLNYYVTGNDPIKDYIDDEETAISGNIGGLYFTSGYLTNYNLSASPNGPVSISASINVFSDLTGEFSPNRFAAGNITGQILNYSDVVIDNILFVDEDFSSSADIITKYNYSFSNNIEPVYYVRSGEGIGESSLSIDHVTYNKKSISTSITLDQYTGDVPTKGKTAGLNFSLRRGDATLIEEYKSSGIMTSRNLQASIGSLFQTELTVTQNHTTSNTAQVTSYTAAGYSPGDPITMLGTNLGNVYQARIGDTYLENVTNTATSVSATIPLQTNSGLVYVRDHGGEYLAQGVVYIPNFTYDSVLIDSIVPETGIAGDDVVIHGHNFFSIDAVTFNGANATTFQVINTGTIMAQAPSSQAPGPINVSSTIRNTNDNSTNSFQYIPTITGFYPLQGAPGDTITISGTNFGSVNRVDINGVNAPTFVSMGSTEIDVTVPAGDIRGNFAVGIGSAPGEERTGVGQGIFEPLLTISSISPSTARAGDSVVIAGTNFVASHLYTTGNSLYLGSFNNAESVGGTIDSSISMTFTVPNGAETGPFNLLLSDGATSATDGVTFTFNPEAPLITDVTPNVHSISDGAMLMSVAGSNFTNIQNIIISGTFDNGGLDTTDHNTGEYLTFTTSDFTEDLLGKLLITDASSPTPAQTGSYILIVSGAYFASPPVLTGVYNTFTVNS